MSKCDFTAGPSVPSGRGSLHPVKNKGKSGIFCHYTVFAHRPTSFFYKFTIFAYMHFDDDWYIPKTRYFHKKVVKQDRVGILQGVGEAGLCDVEIE